MTKIECRAVKRFALILAVLLCANLVRAERPDQQKVADYPAGTTNSAPQNAAAAKPWEPQYGFHWWIPFVPVALALGFLSWFRGKTTKGRAHDPQDFVRAMRIWAPWIMPKLGTPRELRRFENWMRYLARHDAQRHFDSYLRRGNLSEPAGELSTKQRRELEDSDEFLAEVGRRSAAFILLGAIALRNPVEVMSECTFKAAERLRKSLTMGMDEELRSETVNYWYNVRQDEVLRLLNMFQQHLAAFHDLPKPDLEVALKSALENVPLTGLKELQFDEFYATLFIFFREYTGVAFSREYSGGTGVGEYPGDISYQENYIFVQWDEPEWKKRLEWLARGVEAERYKGNRERLWLSFLEESARLGHLKTIEQLKWTESQGNPELPGHPKFNCLTYEVEAGDARRELSPPVKSLPAPAAASAPINPPEEAKPKASAVENIEKRVKEAQRRQTEHITRADTVETKPDDTHPA